MTSRSTEQRIAATLRRLESDPDVWIATASPQGVPHLVPLSLAWSDGQVLVATPTETPTVRNIAATERARAALDSTNDVVVIEASATATSLDEVGAEVVELFTSRVGWNPRKERGAWSMLALRPRMIHAWNSVSEIEGRTIMRRGEWLTG